MNLFPILTFGGGGQRAGFLSARVGDAQLDVAVLPKLWGKSDRVKEVVRPDSCWPGRVFVTVYEGDSLQFSFKKTEDQNMAAELAMALAIAADAAAKKESKQESEGGDPERPGEKLSPLVVLTWTKTEPNTETVLPGTHSYDLDALLGLALLAHKAERDSHVPSLSVTYSGGGGTSLQGNVDNDSPVLRLLLASQLVRLVESRLREIRQGYMEREERTSIPRGRIRGSGLLRYAATGSPELLCVVDEFTQVVPLYQVIVTTLECLGAGEAAVGVLGNSSIAEDVRDRAVRLRAALSAIPARPVAVAAALSEVIRLPRLWQRWAPILEGCATILRQRSPRRDSGDGDEGGTLVWVVNTARLWERLVEESLARFIGQRGTVYFKGKKRGQNIEDLKCQSPWKGVGNKSKDPDLFVALDTVCWVLDAKYKELEGLSGLSSDDQYQLFAYSLLAKVGERLPEHAAVVRPEFGKASASEAGSHFVKRNFQSNELSSVVLHDIQLPFPARSAAMNDLNWADTQQALDAAWPKYFFALSCVPEFKEGK